MIFDEIPLIYSVQYWFGNRNVRTDIQFELLLSVLFLSHFIVGHFSFFLIQQCKAHNNFVLKSVV